MNILKFLHNTTGVAALAGVYLSAFHLAPQSMDNLSSGTLLLACTASANLILASFNNNFKSRVKAQLINLSSLLIIISSVLLLLELVQPLAFSATVIASALLVAAALIHRGAHVKWSKFKRKPSYSTAEREKGTVKWFNVSKGFGFISRNKGDDVFVHFRAIRGEGHRVLIEGQDVDFVISQRDKGLQAEDVIAL